LPHDKGRRKADIILMARIKYQETAGREVNDRERAHARRHRGHPDLWGSDHRSSEADVRGVGVSYRDTLFGDGNSSRDLSLRVIDDDTPG